MEGQLRQEFKHQIEVLKLQMSTRIPPEPVRLRIESLEQAMDVCYEKLGLPPYRPPTSRFHNDLWTLSPQGDN